MESTTGSNFARPPDVRGRGGAVAAFTPCLIADASSINAVNFSSAVAMKRFHPRCDNDEHCSLQYEPPRRILESRQLVIRAR
jgi:hypothetical protein